MRVRGIVAVAILLFIAGALTTSAQNLKTSDTERARQLGAEFDQFRRELRIPGMSAIILRDRQIVWKAGFGYADIKAKRPYTPDTPQHIASLTKAFAATLVMQLVETGKLDLGEPVADYVPDIHDRRVQMKHLLSHTSEGTPGEQYRYSGDRYDLLSQVLEKKTGRSFRHLVSETFMAPLGMDETVPGQDVLNDAERLKSLGEQAQRYEQLLSKIALPYALYGQEIVPTAFPPQGIGAAAGLISTVNDLAKFDIAIDENRFLKSETQALIWTPFIANSGKPQPHGLGWFAETFGGDKLVWHYGHWPGMYSATYVKVPEKKLTMILLANSEAASAPFYLTGGIETSVFACSFLKKFAWNGADHGCERVAGDAMHRWLADCSAAVRQPFRVPAEVLKGYAGEYRLLESGTSVSVTYRADQLFISLPRKFPSELFAESRTRFFLKTVDYEITFVPDASGKAVRLYIHTPGEQHEAEKAATPTNTN